MYLIAVTINPLLLLLIAMALPSFFVYISCNATQGSMEMSYDNFS